MTSPTTHALEGALAQCLVETLHQMAMEAGKAGDPVREHVLTESACLLDGYQAGLVLARPHPATGFRLVPFASQPAMEGCPA